MLLSPLETPPGTAKTNAWPTAQLFLPRFNAEAEAVVYGQPQRQTDWSTSKGLLPIRAAEAPGSRQVHGPCPLQQTKVESSALYGKGGLPIYMFRFSFYQNSRYRLRNAQSKSLPLQQV